MKLIVLAAAALALACIAKPSGAAPPPQSKSVHSEGCVEAGVENRCLIVKDLKAGVLYNVLIKDPKPNLGEGIEFTGAPHDGPSTCMQGIAVDVTSWTRKDSLKCSQPQEPNK